MLARGALSRGDSGGVDCSGSGGGAGGRGDGTGVRLGVGVRRTMIVSSSRSSHDIIAEITESNVNMDQVIKFIMHIGLNKN